MLASTGENDGPQNYEGVRSLAFDGSAFGSRNLVMRKKEGIHSKYVWDL